MSGGGGGVIIIHSAIASGALTPDDSAKLQAIADRSPVRCSVLDFVRVCRILAKYLRP